MTFNEFLLQESILRALSEKGYETPTEIQNLAIPIFMEGSDVLAQSQTGTGKTAAFGLPMINRLEKLDKRVTQGLVLCPTRELCMQVAEELRTFMKFVQHARVASVYGGEPIDRQIRDLRRGCDIVVATPGRLLDHLRRKTIRLNNCSMLVLDEADEMLNMGFLEDIETVLEYLPEETQKGFFSATMPKAILELSNTFLKDPKMVRVSPKNVTSENIKQIAYSVTEDNKVNLIAQLFSFNSAKSAMVFCNTKRRVDEVVDALNAQGILCLGLHGDMKQEMRTQVMGRFKKGNVQILVATDVAARGIDVQSMDMVINYDVPQETEYYVHRIGRTGRNGRDGLAITFVTPRQRYQLRNLERLTKSTIEVQPLPTEEDLKNYFIESVIQDVQAWKEKEVSSDYEAILNALENEGLSLSDFMGAMLAAQYEKSSLKPIKQEQPKERKRRNDGPMVTLALNVGGKEHVSPATFLKIIAKVSEDASRAVGDITIKPKESFMDVPEKFSDVIADALHQERVKGRKITVEKRALMKRRQNRDGGNRRRKPRN
ncbi:hypothetical protein AOC36_00235 [Erysipelothrix larvae]|uniref:ATP-dependent RNA helicase CshA n=1 Tax=Erysipelothrix larvae TaxID=1514105 RepID=A0A0X8GYE1_9FIRM|nr:DEAD/DEAH box helicase [Erysipelothrix larvae]AMC92474.1 hypothetical protein AOC36_00235 [Erysipelothrix larvae]